MIGAPDSLPPTVLHVHRTPFLHTVLVWGLALVAFGVFEGAQWLTTTETGSPIVRGSDPTPGPPSPQEISVRAILELPSPTPTATSAPKPTQAPTVDPYRDLPRCNASPVAGQLCQIPKAPPPTPTPWPECPDVMLTPANGGDLCMWSEGK